ncbi:hypothetical protein AY599_21660 [Leptolyngbya valderiana BDU 20041]|nr:hypothetical protein AY599_21660 [Leptolyngbya valderiana BDU 20041]
MAESAPRDVTLRARILRLVLVVVLSIAIWTFAEARSLTSATRTVTLVLTAPTGSPLTAWADPEQARRVTVALRLEGSRAALQRAGQRFDQPIELLIGDGLSAETGRQTVSLRDTLRDHAVFDRLAVSLVSVSPPSIDVRVDELVQRSVPIRVLAPGAELNGPPVAEPATATVTGPSSMLGGAGLDTLEATVPQDDIESIGSGSTARVPNVPLTIPEPWRSDLVRVEPATVTATLALRDTIESHTLSSVPVMIRLSPTQLRQWSVRIAPEEAYLRDVRVSGPSEAVQAIAGGRARVVATLFLEGVELSPGSAEFAARLSGEVEGLQFEVADNNVPVQVTAVEPEGEGGEN